MTTAYGIDLSGHGATTTGVVKATLSTKPGLVEAHVLRKSKWRTTLQLESDVTALRESIRSEMVGMEVVAVDVPLDLTPLASQLTSDASALASRGQYAWQYVKRPVDHYLGGLEPLASYLGAVVSRWRALAPDDWQDRLDETLFETYPQACLELSGISVGSYKSRKAKKSDSAKPPKGSRAKWSGKEWSGAYGKSLTKRNLAAAPWTKQHPLARVLRRLKVKGEHQEFVVTDDEVDALICSLVALGIGQAKGVMRGPALWKYVRDKAGVDHAKEVTETKGYALLNGKACYWKKIVLHVG